MDKEERPLSGGNSTESVVRVGSTVRKPWTAATSAVFEYMAAVRAAGVDVPAVHGSDDQGRGITEFVPGALAMDRPPLSAAQLTRVGRIVRTLHDASSGFTPTGSPHWDVLIPAPDDELICHNDLAPWNLIVGQRWVFIDWDGAGPSTRLWDLAYSAQAFTLSDVNEDPQRAATRLAALVDGYAADQDLRRRLAATIPLRAAAMYDLLHSSHQVGREPWAAMYTNGHGQHWRTVTNYARRHQHVWEGALLTPAIPARPRSRRE